MGSFTTPASSTPSSSWEATAGAFMRGFVEKGLIGAIHFPTVGLNENLLESGLALRKHTAAVPPGVRCLTLEAGKDFPRHLPWYPRYAALA